MFYMHNEKVFRIDTFEITATFRKCQGYVYGKRD